jgi:phosphonate metabolism protein (transferase hexapeptide repeat family)
VERDAMSENTSARKMMSVQPLVHPSAEVKASTLGRYTEVGARTKLLEAALADYSYVVNDSDIAYAQIGKFCSIAALTRINPGNHPMHRASQAHFTYRASTYFAGEDDDHEFFAWRRAHRVTIGHDVWIGHGAIVLPGRSIGTGAVIAAGAIVTKDVAPYTIVAGNPARVIRPRFAQEIAARLQALAWWDWPHEKLRAALADFRALSVETFLDRHEGAPGRVQASAVA